MVQCGQDGVIIVAEARKQSKCRPTDEWIKKMWYNGILFAIKRNEITPFTVTWMDLEILILSEISQRKTNTIEYHLYVESKI